MRLPKFPSVSSTVSALFMGIVGLFVVVHEPFWVAVRAIGLTAAFGYALVSLIALINAERRKSREKSEP